NTIAVSAQLASSSGRIPPDSQDALSQIERSVRGIARLISDLTDFASTGLGGSMPLSRIPINLEVLCRESVHEIQAGQPGRQINCELHGGDMTLIADGARLRQVISNLLGNAIQHGSPNGPITLSLADE